VDRLDDAAGEIEVAADEGPDVRSPGRFALAAELPAILRQQNFEPLPIAIVHALRAGNLPGPHRDPFDRMLIAQAQHEHVPILTADPKLAAYGVELVW
jgi:PIN domain nuclease of toxin-antitoxin system